MLRAASAWRTVVELFIGRMRESSDRFRPFWRGGGKDLMPNVLVQSVGPSDHDQTTKQRQR